MVEASTNSNPNSSPNPNPNPNPNLGRPELAPFGAQLPTIVHLETGRHLYGGALQVLYLHRTLLAWGLSSVLLCPIGSELAQRAKQWQLPVQEIKAAGDIDVGLAWRVAKLLRGFTRPILHVHSRRGADSFGWLAAKFAGCPALITRRVDNPERGSWARFKYARYQAVRGISNEITAVLRRTIAQHPNLATIRSAVDTEQYQPDQAAHARLCQQYQLPADSLIIGVVAQLIERKGHRDLLAILPELIAQFPTLRVLCFGRGPLEAQLQTQIAERQLSEHVQLVGFSSELAQLMPGFDLLVHPAYAEGLGVSLLQASSAGVAIIAGRAGGIPEAVLDGVNGLLFTPGDQVQLKQLCQQVLADTELRQQLGQGGRALMVNEFSIAVMAEQYWQVYQQLLNPVASDSTI